MKANLNELLYHAHSRFLEAQRMKRFLESSLFEDAYKNANEHHIRDIIDLIKSKDVETLREYCKTIRALEDQPVMELRKIAKHYRIVYYAQLDKLTLIERIREYESNPNSKSIEGSSQGSEEQSLGQEFSESQ